MLLNPYRFPSGGGGSDPYWASVSALLHFDGLDGSSVFVDVKGNSFSAVGGVALSGGQKKFGTASMAGASGSYVYTPVNDALYLGSKSFTMEMWSWVPASLASNIGLVFYVSGGGFEMFLNASNKVQVNYRNAGNAVTGEADFPRDQWVHLAIERDGSELSVYLDGVHDQTASAGNPFGNGAMQIGAVDNSGWYLPGGFIDDFRLTVGVARYKGPFAPPTAAFPDA